MLPFCASGVHRLLAIALFWLLIKCMQRGTSGRTTKFLAANVDLCCKRMYIRIETKLRKSQAGSSILEPGLELSAKLQRV